MYMENFWCVITCIGYYLGTILTFTAIGESQIPIGGGGYPPYWNQSTGRISLGTPPGSPPWKAYVFGFEPGISGANVKKSDKKVPFFSINFAKVGPKSNRKRAELDERRHPIQWQHFLQNSSLKSDAFDEKCRQKTPFLWRHVAPKNFTRNSARS